MDPWQASVDRRLGTLETDVGGIKDILLSLKLDMAEMKGKVSNLPTTLQLWAAVGGSVGLAAALVFGAIKLANP